MYFYYWASGLSLLSSALSPTGHLFAHGALVNLTVDDAASNPLTGDSIIFAPAGEWNYGPECKSCLAQPDPSKAFMGTWHDTTFVSSVAGDRELTATLSFNGTLITRYYLVWSL